VQRKKRLSGAGRKTPQNLILREPKKTGGVCGCWGSHQKGSLPCADESGGTSALSVAVRVVPLEKEKKVLWERDRFPLPQPPQKKGKKRTFINKKISGGTFHTSLLFGVGMKAGRYPSKSRKGKRAFAVRTRGMRLNTFTAMRLQPLGEKKKKV